MNFGQEYFDYCKNKNGFDMRVKSTWQEDYVKYVSSVLDLKNKKCLDHGCALGSQTSAFIDKGFDFIGIDIDKWYVDNTPFTNMKNKIFTLNKNKFPFKKEEFDVIHSSQTIEHIPFNYLELTVKEFHRILKTNGIVYIGTVEEGENGDPTHVSTLSKKQWQELFISNGFSDQTFLFEHIWEKQAMYIKYKWVQFVFRKEEK